MLTALTTTFPGWPSAPNPSVSAMLVIFLGIPMAIAGVIFVLGMTPTWVRRNKQPHDRGDVAAATSVGDGTESSRSI